MRVFNPSALTFDGEAVLARIPARIVLDGDFPITPEQGAAVASLYATFAAQVRAGSIAYQVKHATLPDGTSVRMVSNSGEDRIFVRPTGGSVPTIELAHGLVVKPAWTAPAFYRYAPGTDSWSASNKPVPQIQPSVIGYNEAQWADKKVVVPLVSNPAGSLWIYSKRSGPDGSSITPIDLSYIKDAATVRSFAAHAIDGKTITNKGATLYTMSDPPALITPADTAFPLQGNSTGDGLYAVLRVGREASLSGSVTGHSYCSEVIKRTDKLVYEAESRTVNALNSPVGSSHVTVTDVTASDLDEVPSVALTKTTWILGIYDSYWHGYLQSSRVTTTPTSTSSVNGYRHQFERAADSFTDLPTLVMEDTGHSAAVLRALLFYPYTEYWRGGIATKNSDLFTEGHDTFGIYGCQIERRDAQFDMAATPAAELHLQWNAGEQVVSVLAASVNAKLEGKYYVDTTDYYATANSAPTDSAIAPDDIWRGGANPDAIEAYYAGISNTLGPIYSVDFSATLPNGPVVTSTDVIEIYNTGDYTYTSKHIIDYDHRMNFYAAIVVEVQCTGARWDQVPGTGAGNFRGNMQVTADPSYVVTIKFESNWAGTLAQQTLASGTCTRPAFEFAQITAPYNIFYYPVTSDATYPLNYHLPPMLELPAESIHQIKALAGHQGVNKNLCGADAGISTDMRSASGLEFSTVAGDTIVRPQSKWVAGQLYARTFKLSDFPDALWLLPALSMDAALPGGDGTLWYYLPDLKTTIDTQKFHIEVRNGAIVQWSDDFPPTEGDAPSPTDRDIELYKV